ncbi:MAG TPA: hypothetical protein VM240_00320, partial [Verrucomicrobiae bacterium]|nr:hypothetical protein [Verrucomicrobiae bacterium]
MNYECDWRRVAVNPQMRQQAVRDFAVEVMGDEAEATRWLGKVCYRIRGGRCSVAAACESAEGFFEAMAELACLADF